ncbi:hypothetical protein CDES_05240 [Corynebacterium deserti GIMN1.010]|uniref:TIGR02206 family membrane protein n=1 Tax=Corynebacterium deserti GIMN1.010 TaxID=931089 RepID=A0A0M4CL60_9CORY|nr:TIGR02206 family membrane protein [Corynebacterium deserti]ALC05485.1 hypothetical protein CDES_05240 [Corynebacterium deserti GIMN1.010]
MESSSALGYMPQYGVEHISMLVLTVVTSVVSVPAFRRFNAAPAFGWLLLAAMIFWTAWGFLPGNYTIEQSWPLHFSDALRVIAAIALITRAKWAVAVTILWGTTINLMSLIFPDVHYMQVPWLEFVMYWLLHIAVFVAALVLVFSFGEKLGFGGVVMSIIISVAWGLMCLVVNETLGSNYGYLSREPESSSLLDVFGGWPFYIVVEALILFLAWSIWAWAIQKLEVPYLPKTRKVTA